MKKILLYIFALLMTTILFCGNLSAQDYKIIVSSSNTISTMSKKQVSKLFLKKKSKWDNGQKALPVDQSAKSSVRVSFSKQVLGKKVSVVKTYWQQQLFSGRATAPPELSSDAKVIEYIINNPGSIGYVSKSAKLDKVKVLKITD